MRNVLYAAGAFALAGVIGLGAASAQSIQASENASVKTKGNVHVTSKTSAHVAGTRSLARADQVAGTHGAQGRANARLHGSHRTHFCPPGQAKKPGLGSRFHC